MGLPSLTRGVGYRDDFQTVLWAIGTGVTATSDGDILSLSGTSSTNVGQGMATGNFTFFSTSAYPTLLIRASGAGTIDFTLFFSDVTTQTFTLALSSKFTVFTNTLTPGKTVGTIEFINQSVAGTITIDFVMFCKEVVTLPSASKSLRQRRKRRLVSIPIPFREGDIVQDLGSDSPEYDIAGQLVASNYTADQWWGLLNALMLETGIVQADGNPTWQWFQWDQGGAKVLPASFVVDENPGRVQNWDYQLQLKQFDVLGETLDNNIGVVLNLPAPNFIAPPPPPPQTTHVFNWNDGTKWTDVGV